MTPTEQRIARLRIALSQIASSDASIYDARRTALNALAVDDHTPSES